MEGAWRGKKRKKEFVGRDETILYECTMAPVHHLPSHDGHGSWDHRCARYTSRPSTGDPKGQERRSTRLSSLLTQRGTLPASCEPLRWSSDIGYSGLRNEMAHQGSSQHARSGVVCGGAALLPRRACGRSMSEILSEVLRIIHPIPSRLESRLLGPSGRDVTRVAPGFDS